MKKGLRLLLIIFFCFVLSLFIPFFLVNIKTCIGHLFGIDEALLPTTNYIQAVASLTAFLAATLISYSVYQINLRKDKREEKENAYDLVAFLKYSISNINNYYVEKTTRLQLETKPPGYAKILYRFDLNQEEIATIKTVIERIRVISLSLNSHSRDTYCMEFTSDEERLSRCDGIIKQIEKRFLV